MNQLQFWANWPLVYKRILLSISLVAAASLGALWVAYFQSPAPTIATEQYQQLETQEIALHSFAIAGITLTTTGDNYLLFEHLKGGLLIPNTLAAYSYVGLLVISMIILLSIITTLNRFWYVVGMGLFILFIVGFRLETTFVFNLSNKIPTVVVLALFGGLSYYFHAFNRTVRLQLVLLAFSGLALLFLSILLFFSQAKDPIMHMAANGMIAGVVLSIAFIFTIAHEILAFFINVITRGVKQTKSLLHFLVISTIYMINLVLTYADRKGYVEWDFLSINLFLLLTLSAFLGLWGFRQREPLYATIVQANPLGVYLFISLAVICFATISFFLASANDPAVQLIQDTIMYSHLGYGLIFICYIIANFGPMLANNLQVYKVLYNPNTMPYFTFRLAGLIATFAFFAYSVYSVSIHQLFAGYYDATGDAYVVEGDRPSAESYYHQSLFYSNRNHHAHYALASMEAQRFEPSKEKKHYELAAETRPTELSYLNLSLALERDGEHLQANNALLQGLQDFPASGKLLNALGLSYATLGLRDSALLTLEQAKQRQSVQPLAEANLVGVLAKFNVAFPADSLNQLVGLSEKGAKTNALALANQQGVALNIALPTAKDSILTVYEATLLNNYILNRFDKVDTALLHSIVTLARRPSNSYYKTALLDAAAQSYYAHGEVQKAFNLLSENAFVDSSGKMYNTLGLWALEQGNAQIALAEFNLALNQQFAAAHMGKALALSALANEAEAKRAWQTLVESKDTTFRTMAQSFIKIYSAQANEVNQLSDLQKYQYSHFRIPALDTSTFVRVIATLNNNDLKARAVLDKSKKLWALDEPQAAANMIGRLQELPVKDPVLYNQIIEFNLQLLVAARDFKTVKEQYSRVPSDAISIGNQLYFEALLANMAGDNEKAKTTFEWLASSNPFNVEATLDGINYVRANTIEKLKAFTLLVSALSTNPGSPKLLKAYIVEAATLGFDTYAQESLDTLKTLISPSAYGLFVREHPEIFQAIPD